MGLHDGSDGCLVVLCQKQVFYSYKAQQGPVVCDVAGVDGFFVHAGAADAEDTLFHRHRGAQGDVFCGHHGASGVFGVTQELVDGFSRFRVSLGQNPTDHIGRHLLHQVYSIVQVQFVHHFLELAVGKALNQQLLGLRVHFHKGFRRLLLR